MICRKVLHILNSKSTNNKKNINFDKFSFIVFQFVQHHISRLKTTLICWTLLCCPFLPILRDSWSQFVKYWIVDIKGDVIKIFFSESSSLAELSFWDSIFCFGPVNTDTRTVPRWYKKIQFVWYIFSPMNNIALKWFWLYLAHVSISARSFLIFRNRHPP